MLSSRCASVGVFLVAVACARGADAAVRIEPAEAAPAVAAAAAPEATLVLFGGTVDRMAGWSHIATQPARFPHVRFAPENYAVDATARTTADAVPAFRTILVKKLGDWDQQHANGLEPLFADAPVEVGRLRAVVLELRIDAARSRIPSVADVARVYGDRLAPAELAALDDGRAWLGVTVLEAGFNAHDGRALHGTVYVPFDPARDFDRWLRVTIPGEAFEFYFETNYQPTPARRADHGMRRLVGLRINPETKTALVARNFLRERFGPATPELYKEIALTLRRLEVRRGE